MAAIYGKGFESSIDIVPEVTFGTLDTNNELTLPFISETLTHSIEPLMDEIKDGVGPSRVASIKDMEQGGGTVISEASYLNINELLIQAFGTRTGAGLNVDPYLYTPKDEILTSYSLVVNRNVKRYQYTGGVIEEIRIVGDMATSKIRIETDWIFQSVALESTAIVNPGLVASSIALMSQMVFRIGTVGGGALGASDVLPLSTFTFRIKNNFQIDFASGSAFMIQPIRGVDQREVSFEFTSPRYSDDPEIAAVMAAATGHTALQADLTWTGPSPQTMTLELPEIKTIEVPAPNVTDMSAIPFSASFNCFKNLNNQTFMSGSANLEVSLEKGETS